jgi:NADH-quinone oxidoreductase subunit G
MSAKPDLKAPEPPETDMVTIEVNGRPLKARKGSMVIQVTDAAGIYIPRFCYHHKLSVAANCRMCLVEIEKAPKPMPACATPVVEGMKVYTRSTLARDAQKGVMEFLLINHPLDCPVCDQGGECPLQDLALGYGKDVSRYAEKKRVVHDQDIGPLIATEMTRCIHCTRCVRFGQEIAGIMELGLTGRGEHTEIGAFIERSVNSELSGNVIDICPVGALTSKPFRFTARVWELASHPSVSPHDCVGSNLNVQSRRHKVMRVLPRENEAINECWLSDRDRFSYEALNSSERLQWPMIRTDGRWEEVDWRTALDFAAAGLRKTIDRHGSEQMGALAAPGATLEEFYLLQKLLRSLGSANVDHRLHQRDFSDDEALPVFPWLGQAIQALERATAVLLIGCNIRKEQPLLGLRLRKAGGQGGQIMAINPLDYDFGFTVAHKVIAAPSGMLASLAGVVHALADLKKRSLDKLPPWFLKEVPGERERNIAQTLARAGDTGAVLLGGLTASHPQAATLRALADLVGELAGARLGTLAAANAAGAWLAGCVPHRTAAGVSTPRGRDAHAMISEPLKAYVLLGVEPELDCLEGVQAGDAMAAAEFVVMLTPFKPASAPTRAMQYADVLLPLAPFTETEGTFVNCEGRPQSFTAAVRPLGEARPGWKILRVLGNHMGQPGFAQETVADVRAEIPATGVAPSNRLRERNLPDRLEDEQGGLARIYEVPMYRIDSLVRRAPALQRTADNPQPAAYMNDVQAKSLGLADGASVVVRVAEDSASLNLVVDARVADGCVLIPAGYSETAALGVHGSVSVVEAKGT